MGRSSKSAITKVTDFFYERIRHKDAWSAAHTEPTAGFGALAGHKTALLMTYRQNGEGVPSPVWIGRDDQDRVYFDTEEASGKVKRIRNNPQVRLTPAICEASHSARPPSEPHASSTVLKRPTPSTQSPPTTA